jgi:hypothetical protein
MLAFAQHRLQTFALFPVKLDDITLRRGRLRGHDRFSILRITAEENHKNPYQIGRSEPLGPYSRIAGLLLFPLRPFRGKLLSTTTEFPFQWRRNRFACRDCLLWRLFGRANWLGR